VNPTQTLFFSTSSARPNIHYEVRYFSETSPQHAFGDDQFTNLVDWLRDIGHRRIQLLRHLAENDPSSITAATLFPITGIIYVPLRFAADTLAPRLLASSITCQAYHAGLELPTRVAIQTSFTSPSIPTLNQALTLAGTFNIIAATTAFGMGIDAPQVRFVAHYGLPRALEQFVQESGRAGRDGKAAVSILFYTREERDRVRFRVKADAAREARNKTPGSTQSSVTAKEESLQAVIQYCEETRTCRHKIIATYFGDEGAECDFACDYCKEGEGALGRRKGTGLASDEAAYEYTQREAKRGEFSQVQEGDPYDYWSLR
jgi:superfamily II DNA helicase RecQ